MGSVNFDEIMSYVRSQLPKEDSIEVTKSGTYVYATKHFIPLIKAYIPVSDEKYAPLKMLLVDRKAFAEKFKIENGSIDEAFEFFRIVVQNPYRHLIDMESRLQRKMEKKRSEKHQLLSQNDPVQLLPKDPTYLDYILANVHFFDPYQSWVTNGKPGGVTVDREVARNKIKEALTKLATCEHTKHVMDALGALIKNEKGSIFISGSTFSLGGLIKGYNTGGGDYPDQVDAYNNHHSIFLRSMIDPHEQRVIPNSLASFIHEAQHFLFQRIVGNDGSPTPPERDSEFDQVLQKDRDHRSRFIDSEKKGSVYQTIVLELEDESAYFRGSKFNPKDSEHRQTMRKEAIVRVMEQLARGTQMEEIKRVAPHLCEFYFDSIKPILIAYTNESLGKGPDILG